MKRGLVLIAIGGVILIIGFFIGRAYQHTTTGYHYTLLEQKDYASELGPIQWTCFLESEGAPFLDPEKTMISLGNRTIYKAQRDFQEDNPRARNIVTLSNSIAWEDGDFKYLLMVKPMIKDGQSGVTNESHLINSEKNSTSTGVGSSH